MQTLLVFFIVLFSLTSEAQTRGFYLGVGFRNQTKTDFQKITDNVVTNSYESEVFYADGASIELGYNSMPQNSFGLHAGLSYGFPQQLSRGSQAGQDIVVTDTNFQQTDLILGTQYRDNKLYLPLAAIYSVLKYSPPPGSAFSATAKGGVGFQAGIGFMPNERLSFETLYRMTATSLTITGPATEQNFGNGELSYLTLVGKVYF